MTTVETEKARTAANGRVSKIRERTMVPPQVCIERAYLVTESHKETESEPAPIRKAKALEKCLKEMSIRIEDKKRKALKVIASIEGKTMGGLVSELLDEYIAKNKQKLSDLGDKSDLAELMKLSEASFSEWENSEDDIYDKL